MTLMVPMFPAIMDSPFKIDPGYSALPDSST